MIDFEEMQKIWNEQKGETMYVLNETALHRNITRKKEAAGRRINRVEIQIAVLNGIVALISLAHALIGSNPWAFLNFCLFAGTVVYILFFRRKRKKAENAFDRSLLGELDHALLNANSIIRINYLMVAGFLIPVFALSFSKMIFEEASPEKWIITAGMLLLALFVVRWEQKSCNLPGRRQLLSLRKKLTEE